MNEQCTLKRNEIDTEYKWALEDLYLSDKNWQSDFDAMRDYTNKIKKYEGKLGKDARLLLEYLRLMDEISEKCSKIVGYISKRADEDTTNAFYQGLRGKCINLITEINSASSFDVAEITEIPDEVLERFYKEEPGLKLYERFFYKIRREKEHVLSKEIENIMASLGNVSNAPSTIAKMFRDADLKFPDAKDKDGKLHKVTLGSFTRILESDDRVLRKSAFESVYHKFDKYKNTVAATLDAQVKQLNFFSKTRKYVSTRQASLYGNEIPEYVYDNLIDVVNKNIGLLHKYMKIRKKVLELDELHMYDIMTPMIKNFDEEINFEEAKKTVYEALKPMGEDYLKIIKEGFENRWIDVYENEGKRSGAYSSGARPHPYVLLNYKNNINSMFTLAHEMGHAVHSYLSMKNQPTVYSNYVIFVAEVASLCNEALLMQHLLKNTDSQNKRAYLINYFLEQFRMTLYRQTMFAEFEMKISRMVEDGETLTAESLKELYKNLNKKYYGSNVTIDEEIAIEWARVPHFYYDFYVFQYATGFAAAMELSQKILNGTQKDVSAYIKFLSSGCSSDPITLLKLAGVDMSKTDSLNDTFTLFEDLLNQFEKLIF